ncbi:MAG: hypothetical protein GY828_05240 [Candidatus Gracilibacteria bacterium]|nr:hypothetical protein [Candidatus Gracilibacteria bacterium]
MKYFIQILLLTSCIFFGFFSQVQVHAEAAIDLSKYTEEIKNISIAPIEGTPENAVNKVSRSILTTVKTVISGLLLIYIVYAGAQMMFSFGTDEEQLTSGKNQIWYTVIAFAFINIPGAIYQGFKSNGGISVGGGGTGWFSSLGSNLFINTDNIKNTLEYDIIGFMEIIISGLAILVILLAGLKILTSRGNEEDVSEGKNRILWSSITLLGVGMIDVWKRVVFKGDVPEATNFFETLANLVLFFAAPTAIVFLTYAAYVYITSNGEEEKIKKAKNIIINVLFATVILLASYTFLLDLITL